MPEVFNEPERFLMQHWAEARALEDSMEEVRAKYQSLCESVPEEVLERHDGLEKLVEVARFSGPAGIKTGVIVLGKRSWPREKRYWTGFWMENLRLEHLADEDEPPPLAFLWVNFEAAKVDEKRAKEVILAAVREVLTPEELSRIKKLSEEDYMLGIEVASKRDLLGMLSTGDTARFVETLASRFHLLAKLTPTLDTLFPPPKSPPKSPPG